MKTFLLVLCVLAAPAFPQASAPQKSIETKAPFDGFDDFANSALKNFDAPGMAIAVVKDGKVILSKGFGLRDVKNNLPVTPKTMFAIGSSTKSFTVVSLAALVDEGKIEWDKPVRDYMPDFRLYDRFASDQMTPRDLVTHRSGLPRHDLMWYSSGLSRQQIFERMRYLEPSKEFRTNWQYQNLMYMTAGMLASKVSGMAWEEHVRKAVFQPLGMASSNFSVADMQKAPEPAKPYMKLKDKVAEVPYRNIDEIGPAGSINSTVEDMIKYVSFHLNKGKADGKQVLSESNVKQMQMQQMVMPGETPFAEVGASTYGMGFFITTYRGHKLVHHGGNIDGFSALVTFMPQDNFGMIILTNANGSPVPNMVSYNVYDRLLGLDQVDWTKRLKEAEGKAKAAAEEAAKKKVAEQKANTKPSHDLADYVGEFEHPAYGTIAVAQDKDGLTFRFHDSNASLKHFHYDVFEVTGEERVPLNKQRIMFQSNVQGDIDTLSAPLDASVKPIAFTRKGSKKMTERTFLEPFVGSYMLGAESVSVELKNEVLMLTVPGQSAYELIPVLGTKFTLKGLTGYSVEFKKDGAAVTDAVFYQPNGTFVAKRK